MSRQEIKDGGARRSGFCFTVTEISYVVEDLLHDLVQQPS